MVSVYQQSAEAEDSRPPAPPRRSINIRNIERDRMTPIVNLSATEIRELRIASDMSQTAFGLFFGVVRNTVDYWEQGKRRPSPPVMKLLALARRHGLSHIQ